MELYEQSNDLHAYSDFLASKENAVLATGLTSVPSLHPSLKPHQRSGCEFAIRRGRTALFHDTGLGKSRQQIEWARVMSCASGRPSLILAPLAVAQQTIREAAEIGVHLTRCYSADDVRDGVNISNYDRIDKFDCSVFGAVVLDESSILKSFAGSTKNALCEKFSETPYRLCCTATPAPNDHVEIGNHADFLGIMPVNDMLHRWFINDTSTASQSWRLKRHGVESFWDWVAGWAQCVSSPEDLGFDGSDYVLPRLNVAKHVIDTDIVDGAEGTLFRMPAMSATNLHQEKRRTAEDRAGKVAALIAVEPDEPWLIWCDTDYEAAALKAVLKDAGEVKGGMTTEAKEKQLNAFSSGDLRVLITKPRIAGFGLNWQHCARVAFVGVSYSYESFYQAIRRCWRFGQHRPVDVHVVMSITESSTWEAVTRKSGDHLEMKKQMLAATKRSKSSAHLAKSDYNPTHIGRLPSWIQ